MGQMHPPPRLTPIAQTSINSGNGYPHKIPALDTTPANNLSSLVFEPQFNRTVFTASCTDSSEVTSSCGAHQYDWSQSCCYCTRSLCEKWFFCLSAPVGCLCCIDRDCMEISLQNVRATLKFVNYSSNIKLQQHIILKIMSNANLPWVSWCSERNRFQSA